MKPINRHNKNFTRKGYYKNSYLMSHSNKGYKYYIVIGSRGRGKTYSGKNYLAKKFAHRQLEHWSKAHRDGRPWKTVWGRLSQSAVDKVLENNGQAFFEPEILRKYKIAVNVVGDMIYFAHTENVDPEDYEWVPAIRVMAISKYYDFKGNQFTDYDEIIMDELVRAKGERRSFDISIAFKNFIENIVRRRNDVRCFIYANAIEELNDLRTLFHWIPMPGNFGMFYIQTQGVNSTIIEYLDDSEEWKQTQRVSMAGLLGSKDDSAFTNIFSTNTTPDMIVQRTKLKQKTLLYVIDIMGMDYALINTDQGYVFDFLNMHTLPNQSAQRYTLQRSKANSSRMYSKEIGKHIMTLFERGKIRYPDIHTASTLRNELLDARLMTE